jgi:hypothetical protein
MHGRRYNCRRLLCVRLHARGRTTYLSAQQNVIGSGKTQRHAGHGAKWLGCREALSVWQLIMHPNCLYHLTDTA